ncbi:MAG: hypothetical protein ACOYKH_02585 [Brevefilum fermentans]|jgi:hypothetical protein|nr:hypothetical protein [Brevefilum fermentans]MDI9565463.1 hypothetical protein [Chloroflexota bacterium]HOM67255.1 hypothetical protein [Brevefilum fermentans]
MPVIGRNFNRTKQADVQDEWVVHRYRGVLIQTASIQKFGD